MLAIMLAIMLAAAFPGAVRAAGNVSVLISNEENVFLQTETEISVVFSAQDIGAVSAELEYDPEAMEYVGGENTFSPQTGRVRIALVAAGGGEQSLCTGIRFKPLKPGDTGLSIVSSRILSFSEESELGSPTTSQTFTVTDPLAVTVEKIVISDTPQKLVYAKGSNFDITGMKVMAVYMDGHSEDVTSSAALSGFDSASVGKKTVTVSYEGKTAQFNVYVFGFKSVSLSLLGKIVINFTADFGGMENEGFTPGILFFRQQPSAQDIQTAYDAGSGVTQHTLNGGFPMFSYDDIAAKEMNDIVYCVLYAEKGESVVFGSVSSISAAGYVTMAFNSYSNKDLRIMLVDMLNYGAAAQKYFDYRTDALANASLTDAQKALGTTANVPLDSGAKLYADNLSSEKATIKSASLTLENEISINYSALITDSAEIIKAELLIFDAYEAGKTYDAASASQIVSMKQNGDVYTGAVSNIPAKAMRNSYYARVHVVYADGTEAYSSIGRYSVEAYAKTVRNGSQYVQSLKNLTEAMMRYGDSAALYFAAG